MVVRVRDGDANPGTFSEQAGSWKEASSVNNHVLRPPDVGAAANRQRGPWGAGAPLLLDHSGARGIPPRPYNRTEVNSADVNTCHTGI